MLFRSLAQPAGLERCGGMDIDYLIMQDMRRAIEKEYPGTWEGLKGNKERYMRFTVRLNEMAVKAKHHLSDAGLYDDYIEVAGADEVFYRLTREQLNQMTASLVGQTVSVCRQMLADAGMSASDLSAVLLVGGTSRIPLVQEMAGKIMGKPPLCAADLELSVAQGPLMYLHKQEEIEREQKKDAVEQRKQQDGEKQQLQQEIEKQQWKIEKQQQKIEQQQQEIEKQQLQQKVKDLEEKLEKEEAARQKKEEKDENLILGRHAEKFISSCPYLEKGRGVFDEAYVPMFRTQVHMPVQEKVLLAVNLCVTNKAVVGTVFTNRGIYHRKLEKGDKVGECLFTSWKKFAVSELQIKRRFKNNLSLLSLAVISSTLAGVPIYHLFVSISGEQIASVSLCGCSLELLTRNFFKKLQQHLRLNMQV